LFPKKIKYKENILTILLILSDFYFLFREAANTFLSASICVRLRLIYSFFYFLPPRINENQKRFNPDGIRATKIPSRLNKGNKDLTGQVGQAGQADTHRMTQTVASR